MNRSRIDRASRFVAKKQLYQRGEQNMLSFVKNWNVDAAGLEETVAVLAIAKTIHATFDAKNVPIPEWLDNQIRALNRAVENMTRDARELRLKELLAAQEQDLTPSERREKRQKEIEALKAQGVGN